MFPFVHTFVNPAISDLCLAWESQGHILIKSTATHKPVPNIVVPRNLMNKILLEADFMIQPLKVNLSHHTQYHLQVSMSLSKIEE